MTTLRRMYCPRPSRHITLTNGKPPVNKRHVSAGYMWPDHAHIGRSLRVNKQAWTAH